MKTLVHNYYGTSGQNGTSGGSGGPGVYALNIGSTQIGGGHYLPPGVYAIGAGVEIKGGAGGYGGSGITSYNGGTGGGGGAGGVAVLLGGGTLSNSGTISGAAGGAGGYGSYSLIGLSGAAGGTGGAGGVGVEFTSDANLINHTGGTITGGAGGGGGGGGVYSGLGGAGGHGGVGVSLGAGTLTNAAAITGGAGGFGGFGGVPAEKGRGGPGTGGAGGSGGVGVTLAGGSLTNEAAITGGGGGAGGGGGGGGGGASGIGGAGAAGGSGVSLLGGTLTNHGTITGGVGGTGGHGTYEAAGGSGGTGVLLNGGTVMTTGSISGGIGGNAGLGVEGGAGGGGGAGVTLLTGTLTNHGSLTGGAGGVGGYGYAGPGGAGGSGGAGVLLSGGTLTSSGTISGGSGGTGGGGNLGLDGEYPSAGGVGGNGGAGVYLNGGTLTTSGTISGGAGGAGGIGHTNGAAGAAGDAVQFGSVASTLIVEPGAVFNGQVAANAAVNDTLQLGHTQSGGTAITLGTQFTGFQTVTFGTGADWTVDVGTGAAPAVGLAISGFTTTDTMDVRNLTPSQVQADFNSGTHTLTTPSDGTLHFVTFSGASFLFSNDGSGGTDITLAAGSEISTTLLSGVILGSAAYPSPLTITNTGFIAPQAVGATGVLSDISDNVLTNNGAIDGGEGGGMGLRVEMAGTLTNNGSISGGAGGSGAGGTGADLLAGTLTNRGSLAGGAGASNDKGLPGGAGGAGAVLNGGTLITSGTISGGAGGTGTPTGAAGRAVSFGAAASTLVVDPGAVFHGQVVANAAVNDVLELSGTQSGGTAITMGTQFTNFSTLDFASGARGTVDATNAALTVTGHTLHIDGFAIGDTFDITNLAEKGTTLNFNSSTEVLTLTHGATVITLDFNSAFTGEHFVLSAAGSGTDMRLASGAAATLAGLSHEVMNFVSDHHRAVTDGRIMPAHGIGMGSSVMPAAVAAGSDITSHGFASHAFIDHGLAHGAIGVCKA